MNSARLPLQKLSLSVALALLSWNAGADVGALPNVEVFGLRLDPNQANPSEAGENIAPPADAAELLRELPGVSAGRMGGRGLEPSIRGQSKTQLNVLIDGGSIEGGCPNRMDPPTSFVTLGTIDKVTVLKGVQTLRYGPGGSGGTILFERSLEPRKEGLSGEFALGGGVNSLGLDSSALFRASSGSWYGMVSAEKAEAENYEDGDGKSVRSSFERSGHLLAAGYRINATDRLEFSLERTDTRDALFPGAGMDAPMDRSDQYRLRYKARDIGPFDKVQLDWAKSDVSHLMDNYSLRAVGPMAMRVPSTSDSEDFNVYTEWTGLEINWRAGIQSRDNAKLAQRFAGMNPAMVTNLNSVLWPSVEIDQLGFFVEGDKALGEQTLLTAGVRHDQVDASAGLAGLVPMGMGAMSPNALYNAYYGTNANNKRNESNTGGLVRLTHDFNQNWTGFAGLSRTVRTADATERYLASGSGVASSRWVGNPNIRPEIHKQIDAGIAFTHGKSSWDAVVFHDEVGDYILRDRARGQAGVLLADGASIYRNVDAVLNGVELKYQNVFFKQWAFAADASLVRGQNETDARPLAQIAPLFGSISMDRKSDKLTYGAQLRWAAEQTRVDDSVVTGSGLDAGTTGGWAILNLRASWAVDSRQEVRFGVHNLFDKTYAEHLNRANQDPFNPQAVQVNEPGRSVWVKYKYSF